MALVLLRDWFSIVLANELKGAYEWQRKERETGRGPESREDKIRDRSSAHQSNTNHSKKYQDNGSTLLISCQSGHTAARYVQLVEFLSREPPYECTLSDSFTAVKAKISRAAAEDFVKHHKSTVSEKARGGVLLLKNFDIVFSKGMTEDERLTILVREFSFCGAAGSAVRGEPVAVQSNDVIAMLLTRLERLPEPMDEEMDVTAGLTTTDAPSDGIPDHRGSEGMASQLISQPQPRSRKNYDADVVHLGGINLKPPERSTGARASMDAETRDVGRFKSLMSLLGNQTHGFSGVRGNDSSDDRPPVIPRTLDDGPVGNGAVSAIEKSLRDSSSSQQPQSSFQRHPTPPSDEERTPRRSSRLMSAVQAESDERLADRGSIQRDSRSVEVTATLERPIISSQPTKVASSRVHLTHDQSSPSKFATTPASQPERFEAQVTDHYGRHVNGHRARKSSLNRPSTCLHERSFRFVSTLSKLDRLPQDQHQLLRRPESWRYPVPGYQLASLNIPINILQDLRQIPTTTEAISDTYVPRWTTEAPGTPPSHHKLQKTSPQTVQDLPSAPSSSPGTEISWEPTPSRTQRRNGKSNLPPESSVIHKPSRSLPGTPSKLHSIPQQELPRNPLQISPSNKPRSSRELQSSPLAEPDMSADSDDSDVEMTEARALPAPLMTIPNVVFQARVIVDIDPEVPEVETNETSAVGRHPAGSATIVTPLRRSTRSRFRREDSSDFEPGPVDDSGPKSSPPEPFVLGTFTSGYSEPFHRRQTIASHDGVVESDRAGDNDAATRQVQSELLEAVHPSRLGQIINNGSSAKDTMSSLAYRPELKRKFDAQHESAHSSPKSNQSRNDMPAQQATQAPAQAAGEARREFFRRQEASKLVARTLPIGSPRSGVGEQDRRRERFIEGLSSIQRNGSGSPRAQYSESRKRMTEQSLEQRSSAAVSINHDSAALAVTAARAAQSIPLVQIKRFTTPREDSALPAVTSSAQASVSTSRPLPPTSVPAAQQQLARPAVLAASTDSRTAIFETFQNAYPEYSGNVKHFQSLCRKISSEPMLHRSLWDDFVIRHRTDYLSYMAKRTEEGEDPVSYEQFYHDEIESPQHNLRILNPTTLKTALETASDATTSMPEAVKNVVEIDSSPTASPMYGLTNQSTNKSSASAAPATTPQNIPPSRTCPDLSQRPPQPDIDYAHPLLDSYRPTYSSSPAQYTTPSGPSSQRSRQSLPWAHKPQNSKQNKLVASSTITTPQEEKAHAVKGTPGRFARTGVRSLALAASAKSVSSDASSPICQPAMTSPMAAQTRVQEIDSDAAFSQRDEGMGSQEKWWKDLNTPFKVFTRNYAALKVHGGLLGLPGQDQTLEKVPVRLNVLDWEL